MERLCKRIRMRALLAVAVAFAWASQAQALTLSYSVADSLGPVGSGSQTGLSTSLSDTNAAFTLFMNSPGDGSPLQLNFNASNTSALVQTYVLSVSIPIAPTSFSGGSLAASSGLTLSDGSSPPDSALLASTGGAAIFEATIGGTPAGELFTAPYSLSCVSGGLLPCSTVDSDSATVATLPTLPSASSLGITYQFELSPGDSVAGTGAAVFQTVPEPSTGTLWLVGGALLVGLRRAARRTAP